MRWSIVLILAGLCLSFSPVVQPNAVQPGVVQPDILQQPITLSYQEATLSHILRSIGDRYQIKFAYLNNEMPEDQTFSIEAENQPLGRVLNELLQNTRLSYEVVNQQIVIRRDADKAQAPPPQPPSARSGEASHSSAQQDQLSKTPVSPTPSSEELPKPTASIPAQNDQTIHSSSPAEVTQPPIIRDTASFEERESTNDSLPVQSVDTANVSSIPRKPRPTKDEAITPPQSNSTGL